MKHKNIYFCLAFFTLPLFSSEKFHNHKSIDHRYKFNLQTLLIAALEKEKPNTAWIEKIKKKKVSIRSATVRAVIDGKARAALRLIDEHGASSSATCKEGNSLVMIALSKGHPRLAAELLKRRADVHTTGKGGQDALMLALFFNHPAVAHQLLDMGAKPDSQDKNKQTPLLFASQNNHATIVSRLLAAKAKADHQSKQGFTPLTAAAQKGSSEAIQCLLTHPYSAKKEQKKDLALGLAARNGHATTTQLLLDHGANPDATLPNNYTPLTFALTKENNFASTIYSFAKKRQQQKLALPYEKTTELLLMASKEQISKLEGGLHLDLAENNNSDSLQKIITSKNVNKTIKNGFSPLEIATINYNVDAVRILLENGASTNLKGSRGALLYAAAFFPCKSILQNFAFFNKFNTAFLSIIDLLVQHKIDIEAQNEKGLTALHLLSQSGLVDLAQRLIMHNATIDSTDKSNSTPLMHAANKGQEEAVRLLCQHGAKINWIDKDGDTPLIRACLGGHYNAVKELFHHQKLYNSTLLIDNFNKRDKSALMYAIKGKYSSIIKLLLEHGADPYIKNKKGKNALDFAKSQGDAATMYILLGKIKKKQKAAKKQRKAKITLSSPSTFPSPKSPPVVTTTCSKAHVKLKPTHPLSPQTSTSSPLLQRLQADPIFELIKSGNITISKNTPIDAFALDQNGNTPLIAATKQYKKNPTNQRLRLISKLLQDKNIQQSINFQDEKGKTALLHAATAPNLNLFFTLLASGADPLIFDYWDNTLLTMLIRKPKTTIEPNHLPKLLQFLENRLSPSNYKLLLNQQNSEGKTALMFAAQKGDLSATMMLIDAGSDCALTCTSGFSVREHAQNILVKHQGSKNPNQEKIAVYQKLLSIIPETTAVSPSSVSTAPSPKKSLEKTKPKPQEESSLQKELERGSSAQLKKIQALSKYYSQQLAGGLTPLMLATRHQVKTHIIKNMLQRLSRSHINLAASDGETALYKEIENGSRPRIIDILLMYGMQVRAQDISLVEDKLTKAKQREDEQEASKLKETLRLLMEKKATNIELTQDLFKASQDGDLSLMGRVIVQGANPDTQDMNGNTPLMLSLQQGHTAIAQNLIQNTNLDLQNKNGHTALMISAGQGDYKLVNKLLSKGTNDSLQDAQGKTAYAHALEHNHTTVANRIAINRALSQLKKYGDIQHVLDRHLDKNDTKVTQLIGKTEKRKTKPYCGYVQTKFTSFFPQSWEPYTIFMALKSILASPGKITEEPAEINYQGKIIGNALKIQGNYKGVAIEAIISYQKVIQQTSTRHEWKIVTAYPLVKEER